MSNTLTHANVHGAACCGCPESMRSPSQMCQFCRQELEEFCNANWEATIAEDAWAGAA